MNSPNSRRYWTSLQKLAAVLVFAAAATFASASERELVCAKYETQDGWSKSYKVEATVSKGAELNRATRSFDYEAFATYVVIFWSQEAASVIKLDGFGLSNFESEGIDQEARHWRVRKTSGYCF